MSEIGYHIFRPQDAEGLYELIRNELGYTEVTLDEVRSSLEKMLSSDNYFNLIVGTDSEVYGYISTVREVSLEAGEYYRVIGLAVKQEYQGEGFGTALLTLAEANAKVNGAKLITLSSSFKRTEAHQFYEKLGYEKNSYAFKKYL